MPLILLAFLFGYFYGIYAIIMELQKEKVNSTVIVLIVAAPFFLASVNYYFGMVFALFSFILSLAGLFLLLNKAIRKAIAASNPTEANRPSATVEESPKSTAAVQRKRYLVSRDGSILFIMSNRIVSSTGKGRILPQSARKAKTAEEVRDILRTMEQRENERQLQRKHEEDGNALKMATIVFSIMAFLIIAFALATLKTF